MLPSGRVCFQFLPTSDPWAMAFSPTKRTKDILLWMLSTKMLGQHPGQRLSGFTATLYSLGEGALTGLENLFSRVVRGALRHPWATITLACPCSSLPCL